MTDAGSRSRRTAARRGSRRGSLFGRIVRTFLSLTVLAGLAAAGAAAWLKYEVEKPGPLAAPAVVMVDRGMGTEAIARRLEESGAVGNATVFIVGARAQRFLGNSASLKAGEYEIPAGASIAQIVGILQSGKSITYKLTVPEGLTSQQILERVAAHEVLTDAAPAEVPEGALLPDTYVFQRGMTRSALVDQMRKAHDDVLEELWAKRASDLPINTKDEAVILASIVEKETGIAAERPRVAAVFINRLRQGMRLQSDPTIIYGIVGGKGRLDRPLTRSDIAQKTAYNTYQIDGLPPTPIANPGRASLEAVLNPLKTDELYFVADGTGGHAFAKTLAEHNANVKKWRQIEAARDDEPAPDAGAAAAAPAPSTPAAPTTDTPATEAQAEAQGATAATEPPPPGGEQAGLDPGLPIPEEVPPSGAPPVTEEAAPPASEGLVEVAGRLVPLPRAKPAVR